MKSLWTAGLESLKGFWHRITAPEAAIANAEQRRQAKLLASVLMILLGVTLVLFLVRLPQRGLRLDSELAARIGIVVFAYPAYLCSRRGHVWVTSLVAAIFGSLVLFALAISGDNPGIAVLDYLIVVLLFGSLFLPVRLNLLVFALQLGGMLLLPWVTTNFTWSDIVLQPLSLYLTIGVIVLAIAAHRDLLEQDRTAELSASERRFREIFESSPIGILLYDHEGRLLNANAACHRIFGMIQAGDTGALGLFTDPNVPPPVWERLRSGWTVRYETRFDAPAARGERAGLFVLGAQVHLDVVITPVRITTNVQGYLAQVQDTTERKRAQEELQHANESLERANRELENALATEQQLARTDALTGLANRFQFFEVAEKQFHLAVRYRHPLAAVMLDVDHFKQVNDAFGHAVGDTLLALVAQAARSQLRQTDVIARYGGEELVALLPETGIDQAATVAQRILECVSALSVNTNQGQARVTVSIGIAAIDPAHPEAGSVRDLVGQADEAMYMAKRAGRNRVVVRPYDRSLNLRQNPAARVVRWHARRQGHGDVG